MGRRAAPDRTEPACRLVRFETADDVALAGLLYEPARKTNRAIIWLHGGGGASIFENRRTNLLARTFADRGIAFFPFNNRGSGTVRNAGRGTGGSAFERIRDCVADVDAAIRELWRRGYRDLTLAGHSTGANKVAVYDHYKPRNRAKRYIFLAGGDDTGLLYQELGKRRFTAMLLKAKTMIKARRGEELVPRDAPSAMLSWRSFYDMANPNGDYNVFPFMEAISGVRLSRRPLFRHLRAIRKRSLYVYGERDPYCFGDVSRAVSILSQKVNARSELVVMADADHGFTGWEEELGALIGDWAAGALTI